MGVVFVEEKSNLTLENCILTATSSNSTLSIYGSALLKDCTVNSGPYDQEEDSPRYAITLGDNSCLTMSGTVNINCQAGVSAIAENGKVICLAGTYNFDPTEYVDTETYTVTEANGIWTVAAKTS